MKKQWLDRIFSILLILGLCGSLCSCSHKPDDGTGYLFTCTIAGNPQCLDPQYTDNQNAQIVIDAILEGLVRLDETGSLVMAGAESYTVSDDGLFYEFQLRNDCYWFSAGEERRDAKPVTALDYVFAFRRLLSPETASPYAGEYLCLKNASAVLEGSAKPEQLGISAPDGATLIFELEYPDTDFLSLLSQSCAVPCNEDFFLSTNGRYGLDDKTILCNGAFCLTKWAYDDYGSGNFLTFRKNSTYYNAEKISPSSLQFNIMRSQPEADEDFRNGNSDVILTDTYPTNYLHSGKYTVRSSCTGTLGLIFNPENEILKQKNFREALARGINREQYAEILGGNLQPASGMIPPAVQLLGRPYRELYADEPLSLPYTPEKSAALFTEVLPKFSSSDINALKILLPESFSDTEAILSICQEWQNLSGHYIGIDRVSDREYRSRLASGDYSIALYDLKTPRNSCYASLQNFCEKAEFFGLEKSSLIPVLESLSGDEPLSEKVTLYGEAEKTFLDTLVFIPLFYQNFYLIYTSANTDIFARPFSHSIDFQKAKHFA